MKLKIHPKCGPAQIKCACGNIIKTTSTNEKMEVEVCSACHPTFTGKAKLVDAAGRVDKFKARQEKAAKLKTNKKGKTVKKPAKDKKSKTLKDIKKPAQRKKTSTK